MRCPDCNKFVAYDQAEPEVDVDLEGNEILGTVRIVLNCADCGTELKEATFEISQEVELPEHVCHFDAKPGCPEHAIGTACPVCKWDGKPIRRSGEYKVERYDPPVVKQYTEKEKKEHPFLRLTEGTYIGKITCDTGCSVSSEEFLESEREKFERQAVEAENENRRIPPRKAAVPERNERSFEVEVESAEVTDRSDCGVNKRTGKPNKYNPRFAKTYYGFELELSVSCECGEMDAIQVSAADEIQASAMDELV